MAETVLHTEGLRRQFTLPRESLFRPPETVYALNGVDLSIQRGRSLGVVGESGCGKSTLARLCMALDTPTAGHVEILGRDLSQLSPRDLRQARAQFQMVFQDPYGSLDPRHTVRRIVGETLKPWRRRMVMAYQGRRGRRPLAGPSTRLGCAAMIWTNIHMNSPAGSGSESPSHAPW